MSKSWQINILVWFYRCLLYLYPTPFRQAYERELLQVFKTTCQQTYAHKGSAALTQLWLMALADLLTNVVQEIMMNADRKRRLIVVTGLLFGIPAGILGGLTVVTYASVVGASGEVTVSYVAFAGIVALSIWAGFSAASVSKSAATGLWVGVLVGVIASLIANTTRVAFGFAFYDVVRNDPGEIHDWMRRGNVTFVSYLIDDRIGGYIYTTPFLGLLCGVCGAVGGLVRWTQRKWQSRLSI